ncbi:MAG: hypothetical protein E7262_08620 [Lachnospiraceae bacterium]|nr:hypothetical protein [Lachnospiraceae bacterium]
MRSNRRRRSRSNKGFITAIIIMLLISCVAAYAFYIKTRGNTEKMPLDKYYEITKYNENAIPLIADVQLYENTVYDLEGAIYIEQTIASTLIDSKVYWDAANKSVILTTPTEIVTVPADKPTIYKNGVASNTDKAMLRLIEGSKYVISLDFLKDYVNVEYEVYDNPKRVVMKCGFGDKFTKVKVESDDVVRYKADKQSEILTEVKENDTLHVLTENVQSYMRYVQVMTSDGIIGYVRNMNVGKVYEEVLSNDYKGPEYTPLHMKEKVNLGWLQVSNRVANNSLRTLVSKTSGLNVVSPTWFTLQDTAGGINSFASKDFVTYAHGKGIKVWALIDDFSQTVKLVDVISKTDTRRNLIDNLIAETKECGADGINVDFEHITVESSVHYMQFLRELRIQTRKNNLVLSVDSYVPLSYNAHYNIDEQGEFVDYVVIMAYDEHHSKSDKSGSVASIEYTKTAVTKTLEKVPKEKVIIAVPFYTRLWGEVNGVVDSIETLGMQEALARVKAGGGTATWDDVTKQNYAEYIYQNKTYKVWLEDKKSLAEKLNVIMGSGVAGVGEWRIGYETTDVWPVIKAALSTN